MRQAPEILAKIAAGGMAEVFVARTRNAAGIERLVAIKQMLPEFCKNQEYVDMFLNEGKAMATLSHPNIVQMHDMGMSGAVPFLVMEYLPGHSLQALIRRMISQHQQFTLAQLLTIGRAVCAGLHCAHNTRDLDNRELNIVHRDVSPHNVMLTYSGEVKLIDFGIVRAEWENHETRAGVLKGKLRYMAPEQVQSKKIDRRTDIYAVGVLLFELAAFRSPYQLRDTQDTDFGYIVAITEGEAVDLATLRPDLPTTFIAAVKRAMHIDPDGRYATAADFQEALATIARVRQLELSPAELGGFLQQVMGPLTEPWRDKLRTSANRMATAPASAGSDGDTSISISVEKALPQPRIVALPQKIDDGFVLEESKVPSPLGILFDGVNVERVTPQGVREWQRMIENLAHLRPPPPLFYVNASLALLSQFATIARFGGNGRIVSFMAKYHCAACTDDTVRLVDCEHDATSLAQRRLPLATCRKCGSELVCQDATFYADIVKPWVGETLPPAIREHAEKIAFGASDHHSAVVKKTVEHEVTRLALTRRPTQNVPWAPLLSGIDGAIELDLQGIKLDSTQQRELVGALRSIDASARVRILGCPVEATTQLRNLANVTISTQVEMLYCADCQATRTAIRDPNGATQAKCKVCGQDLTALPKTLSAPHAVVTPVQTATHENATAAPSALGRRQMMIIAGGVLVFGAAAIIYLRTGTPTAKPQATPAANSQSGSQATGGQPQGSVTQTDVPTTVSKLSPLVTGDNGGQQTNIAISGSASLDEKIALARSVCLTALAMAMQRDSSTPQAARGPEASHGGTNSAGGTGSPGSAPPQAPTAPSDYEAIAARLRADLGAAIEPTLTTQDSSDAAALQAVCLFSATQFTRAKQFYLRKFEGWGLAFGQALPTAAHTGVVVRQSANQEVIPIGALVDMVNDHPVKNLNQLAEQGAAKVSLHLLIGDKSWTVEVPLD